MVNNKNKDPQIKVRENKKVLFCCTKPKEGAYVGGVVSIIDNYMANEKIFNANGYDVELFDYHTSKDFPNQKINNFLYGFAQKRALLKKMRSDSVDIVNVHTSREFLFLKDLFLAKAITKRTSAKVFLTIHVGEEDTVFNRIKLLKFYCIKIMNKYIHKVIFLSNHISNQFIESGLNSGKAIVLYNFHCLDNPKMKLKKTNDCLYLLYVGAIHREKGILELLEACVKLRNLNIHLDICGQITDSGIHEQYEAFINNLGDKVVIHGYVKGAQKTELFNRADVLLLPSYHEGMPLVILEALASGSAIISTKVGATPEILSNKNVLWVNIADSDSIANAIVRLYEDRELLDCMSSANKVKGNEFTAEFNIRKLCKIYNA